MEAWLGHLIVFLIMAMACAGFQSCSQNGAEAGLPIKIDYGSNNGKYITVDSIRIYYEEYGQGTPLMLFHGGLSSIKGLSPVIGDLSQHFRVIAIDAPGNGRSEQADSVSFQLMSTYYSKMIDLLKLDSTYVYGFSLGGITALHLAADRPDKVKLLVAHAAVNHLDGYNEGFAGTTEMTPEDVEQYAKWWLDGHLARTPQPDMWKKFITDLQGVWRPEEFISETKLQSIKCPTLIVQGDSDLVKVENALLIHRLIRGSELSILPGTTHFVHHENPELLLDTMLPFLRRTPRIAYELGY